MMQQRKSWAKGSGFQKRSSESFGHEHTQILGASNLRSAPVGRHSSYTTIASKDIGLVTEALLIHTVLSNNGF